MLTPTCPFSRCDAHALRMAQPPSRFIPNSSRRPRRRRTTRRTSTFHLCAGMETKDWGIIRTRENQAICSRRCRLTRLLLLLRLLLFFLTMGRHLLTARPLPLECSRPRRGRDVHRENKRYIEHVQSELREESPLWQG